MKVSLNSQPVGKQRNDAIVVVVYQNGALSNAANELNKLSNKEFKKLLTKIPDYWSLGRTANLGHIEGIQAKQVVVIGGGDRQPIKIQDFQRCVNNLLQRLRLDYIQTAISYLSEINVIERGLDQRVGYESGIYYDSAYQYLAPHQKAPSSGSKIKKINIGISDKSLSTPIRKVLTKASALSEGKSLTMDLGNMPANICTPTFLSKQAREMAKGLQSLSVDIKNETELKRLKMHSFLSVSRGSDEEAKLITLHYRGLAKPTPSKPTIVLVGKGVTFDTGGISLKPGPAMDEMKYDMCGAASVFGVFQALTMLQPKINVVGIVPATENMPGSKATKPGDVVQSMSGQTVEILNTDAEGRLILCDALTYAKRFNPGIVIDIATLTGACVIALGRHASGMFSNNDDLANELIEAGQVTFDRVWRLPLWEEYDEQLHSNFADMGNIGGRDGGAITAACFLSRFTKEYTWAHLDIAGTAWKSGKNKGATGSSVALLLQFILDKAKFN